MENSPLLSITETSLKDRNRTISVCNTLCVVCGLKEGWSASGASDECVELYVNGFDRLSCAQTVFFFTAWAIWDLKRPTQRLHPLGVDEAIHYLSPPYMKIFASLLFAMSEGPEEVDEWITRYQIGIPPV